MLCHVCREGLEGIWDPAEAKPVITRKEWLEQRKDGGLYEAEPNTEPSFPGDYMFGHHPTQESLLQSIADGCVFCNRFKMPFSGQRWPEADALTAKLGYYSLFSLNFEEGNALMGMYFGDHRGIFELVPHNAEDEDLNLNIEPSTDSEGTWRLIRKWLDTCVRDHGECKRTSTSGYIPTRLVELLQTGKTEDNCQFRIVQRHQVDQNSRYLTLSHCWGSNVSIAGTQDNRLKLTKSTEKLFSEKQPISILPKTIREALIVTRRLGLRYLWADRLCIFQDEEDKEETGSWRAESLAMRDVYGNSLLCIAALGATDDEGGFFFTRDPYYVKPTIVNLGADGPGKSLKPYRFGLEKGWAWLLSFEKEPLIKRGWTIQERVLAPRVLHFGRRQVFWECHEANCCEIHPRTVNCYELPDRVRKERGEIRAPDDQKKTYLWKQLLAAPSRITIPGGDDPVTQLFSDWYAVQMAYSRCQLTVSTDKLVALSGLAKDMQHRLVELGCDDTKYLAGIWRIRLPQALVWNVRGGFGDSGVVRSQKYRAPSWSWASLDGVVNPQDWVMVRRKDGKVDVLASLVRSGTSPMPRRRTGNEEGTREDGDGDETGQVVDGFVVLSGKPFIANLLPPHPANPDELIIPDEAHIQNITNNSSQGDTGRLWVETPNLERTKLDGSSHVVSLGWKVLFDTADDVCDQVICLPITRDRSVRSTTVTKKEKDGSTTTSINNIIQGHISGIALVPVLDEQSASERRYRRVGCLSMDVDQEENIRPLFSDIEDEEMMIV